MKEYMRLREGVMKGDVQTAQAETQQALDDGRPVQEILDEGLIAAMDEVGESFEKGRLFVPQMLRSAKTMQECMKLLRPLFRDEQVMRKGEIVIGTVKGDLHDIGKNLVAMMMEGAGFNMTDLGVDIAPEVFVQRARETGADMIAMSALLSITMPAMRDTIEALEKAGLRDRFKVMIGGAPVTDQYARDIGADGYASDAVAAVGEAKRLLEIA